MLSKWDWSNHTSPFESTEFSPVSTKKRKSEGFEAREASQPQFLDIKMKGPHAKEGGQALFAERSLANSQQGNRILRPTAAKKNSAYNMDKSGREFLPRTSK